MKCSHPSNTIILEKQNHWALEKNISIYQPWILIIGIGQEMEVRGI